MDLVNRTPYAVEISRAALIYRDLMLATVVVKASFDVVGGRARLLSEQLPCSEGDADTPLGSIDGDLVPAKAGCDFAVLGHARSEGARPVAFQPVTIKVGSWLRQLVVFGDREWMRGFGGGRISEPKPFVEMPLIYERAFGGRAQAAKVALEGAHPENPRGRGLVLDSGHAEGVALPNLEEPDQLIKAWNQRPLPAGLAPLPRESSLRIARGLHVDTTAQTTQIGPAAFSFSHDRMLLPKFPAGQTVQALGMRHEGPWSFVAPSFDLGLVVELGGVRTHLSMVPDTLCAFPDYDRFFVLCRRAFVYQIRPERLRSVTVAMEGAPSDGNATSIGAQLAAPSRGIPIEPDAPDMPIPFDLVREMYPLTSLIEALPLCPSG